MRELCAAKWGTGNVLLGLVVAGYGSSDARKLGTRISVIDAVFLHFQRRYPQAL